MHTVDWLETHVDFCEAGFNFHDQLFMRKEGDFRDDVEVKREMIKNLQIRKWNRSEATFPLEQVTPDDVLCILDDRQGVVDMWRQEGFRCLQVDAWKEEPKRHHLMDADLDDLNTAELKFLIEHERGHYNEVYEKHMQIINRLVGLERQLKERKENNNG